MKPHFFFNPWQENHYVKKKKNSPLKTKKNFEKSQYLVDNHLYFQVYWSGGTSTPLQKNFIADLDELEHAKKKVVKMSKFWDHPPSPSSENSQLFIFE